MGERTVISRNQLVGSLLHMAHGSLDQYTDIGLRAATTEPELFAHLIAWNVGHGKVRDTKTAFPILALRGLTKQDRDLAENSIASLLTLSPRDLVKAYNYNKSLSSTGKTIPGGHRRLLEIGIKEYLFHRELNTGWWVRTAIQHRANLKALYRIAHVKPSEFVQKTLFNKQYHPQSVFEDIRTLHSMTPQQQATAILCDKLPFEVVVGAADIKNQDVLLALIEGMTGNQVVTNAKMLERLGVMKVPALRAAYNAAVARAGKDKKLQTMKVGKAVEAVQDESMGAQMEGLQAKATHQIGSIEGDWLVLGDRSGSMSASIEMARQIAALITERVKGKVYLVMFNTSPTFFDVTGKTYREIVDITRRVTAGGGTSIGCGLDYAICNDIIVNGIAIVSDGGENTIPFFSEVYRNYCKHFDMEPTIYLFRLLGEPDRLTQSCYSLPFESFDASGMDYYSLPNVVSMLRANRYSLVDEIMATPLLTFKAVLERGVER